MYQFIIVIHVLLGLGIIGLVMMQRGKGADAGAAFGSASSGSVFGAQGAASFLSRTTAIFATLFFISSLGLAMLGGYQNEKVDVMDVPAVEDVKEDVPLVDGSGSDAAPISQDSPQQIIDDNAQAAGQAIDTVEAPATDTAE